MLKIRSFLQLIKDNVKNYIIKLIKRYNRHMAATAYALSAIILVFYFGNIAGFQVSPVEFQADAATYDEVSYGSEETIMSENNISDLKEYALNNPDHNILLEKKTDDEDSKQQEEVLYTGVYPMGQVIVGPALNHYNNVIASMAILTTQNNSQLASETANIQISDSTGVLQTNPKQESVQVASQQGTDKKSLNKETNVDKKTTKNEQTSKKEEKSEETIAKTDTSIPTSLTLKTNKKMMVSLSDKELEVLQRIVEAEATGEDMYGKILVANVVLNRMNDSEFPDTVSEVVFQKVGSSYQFSPTKDGRYYTVKISKATKEAVSRALNGEDYSQGALYFFARKLTTEKKASWFDRTLKKVVQYGCHEFYANK